MRWNYKLEYWQIVRKRHQHTKITEDEELFWINAHPSIEQQSNIDWNTTIHLEVKVPLKFWFMIMTFNLCFYQWLWVKWYVCILQIVLDILDKLIHASQNVCGCLSLKEMHMELTSLIIYSINYNLTTPYQHFHLM